MQHLKTLIIILSAVTFSMNSTALLASSENEKPSSETENKVVDEKCKAPVWAIAIGHEDQWKLHNGCTEPETKKD